MKIKKISLRFLLSVTLSLSLAACGGGGGNDPADPGADSRPVAATAYGQARGLVVSPGNPTAEGKTLVWRGLPFARPPVGDLRWRAPRPPSPWHGVRDASQFGALCTQAETSQLWVRSSHIVGSEDCLYLDVYRPDRDGWRDEALPVYVWIHGGSNNFGASRDYDGTSLANLADAVVVVAQYRLGPLGWFHKAAVQTDGADALSDSGNFGTLDTQRALAWVGNNIGAFGGDPLNITVAGESSGAHNVMNLMVSPLAAGLFQRAIAETPSMATLTPAAATNFANQQIEYLIRYRGDAGTAAEATTLRQDMEADQTLRAYLRDADAKDFFAAILQYGSLSVYGAVEDGVVVPEGGWMPAFRSGDYNQVPLMFGTNEYEAKSFQPLYGPAFKSSLGQPSGAYSWYDLIGVLQGATQGDGSPLTYQDVLPTQADRDVYEATGYYASRAWRAKFIDELAAVISQHQNHLYAYEFQWGSPGSGPEPFDVIYGSGHAAEIPFFHGTETGLFGFPFTDANEAGRRDLQRAMIGYEARFIRTGDPNGAPPCGGADCPVTWKPWSESGGDSVILFNANRDEALIRMSSEMLTLAGVNEAREAAIADFTAAQKATVRAMLPQTPWPTEAP